MAFTYTANRGTTISGTTLVPTATTAGPLFLSVGWQGASRTITGVTDTKSNTWTVVQTPANTESGAVAYCLNPTAIGTGDTITVAYSGSSSAVMSLEEFSGTNNGLDASGVQAATNSTTATATATATVANDLAFLSVIMPSNVSSATCSTPTGYTALTSQTLSTSSISCFYLVGAPNGANSPSSTISSSNSHETVLLLIKPVPGNLVPIIKLPSVAVNRAANR